MPLPEVDRITALEAENQRLRDRVAQLEDQLGSTAFLCPPEWRLSASETRLFGVLLKRDFASKDALMAALYRDDGRDEAEIKIVDVFICKIRRKLKPFGVEIETVWGQGYRMSAAAKREAEGQIQAGEIAA